MFSKMANAQLESGQLVQKHKRLLHRQVQYGHNCQWQGHFKTDSNLSHSRLSRVLTSPRDMKDDIRLILSKSS